MLYDYDEKRISLIELNVLDEKGVEALRKEARTCTIGIDALIAFVKMINRY